MRRSLPGFAESALGGPAPNLWRSTPTLTTDSPKRRWLKLFYGDRSALVVDGLLPSLSRKLNSSEPFLVWASNIRR